MAEISLKYPKELWFLLQDSSCQVARSYLSPWALSHSCVCSKTCKTPSWWQLPGIRHWKSPPSPTGPFPLPSADGKGEGLESLWRLCRAIWSHIPWVLGDTAFWGLHEAFWSFLTAHMLWWSGSLVIINHCFTARGNTSDRTVSLPRQSHPHQLPPELTQPPERNLDTSFS